MADAKKENAAEDTVNVSDLLKRGTAAQADCRIEALFFAAGFILYYWLVPHALQRLVMIDKPELENFLTQYNPQLTADAASGAALALFCALPFFGFFLCAAQAEKMPAKEFLSLFLRLGARCFGAAVADSLLTLVLLAALGFGGLYLFNPDAVFGIHGIPFWIEEALAGKLNAPVVNAVALGFAVLFAVFYFAETGELLKRARQAR